MMLLAFAFLDTKVGAYTAPFFMPHRGQAIRAASELAGDRQTTIGRHPADFSLVELGTFDDATGVLQAVQPLNLGPVVGFLPENAQSNLPLMAAMQKEG